MRARESGGNPGNSGFAAARRAGLGHVHTAILWRDQVRDRKMFLVFI